MDVYEELKEDDDDDISFDGDTAKCVLVFAVDGGWLEHDEDAVAEGGIIVSLLINCY